MRRVLFVIHTPTFGGPHNQALRLCKVLADRGWELIVLTTNEQGNGAQRLRHSGIKVLEIPLHRIRASLNPKIQFDFFKGILPEISNIREIIRDLEIDLVQVAGVQNFHGALAGRLEQIPVVWQLLGTYAPPIIRKILSPLMIHNSDVIMTTGRKVMLAHPGVEQLGSRVITFFPPVDTKEFHPDESARIAARLAMSVPQDAILVGTVGNWCRPKRHDILIKAVNYLFKKFSNLFVRILGSPVATQNKYYESQVKSLAKKFGLLEGDRLQFMSPGERVAQFLPAFDVFVLTSEAEGIPTVVLEAMACGLPVVATDVGSVSEVVQNGGTGFLVPPFDAEAVAKKTGLLVQSLELRRKMGEEARRLAENLYDLEKCADVHIKAYELALEVNMARKKRVRSR